MICHRGPGVLWSRRREYGEKTAELYQTGSVCLSADSLFFFFFFKTPQLGQNGKSCKWNVHYYYQVEPLRSAGLLSTRREPSASWQRCYSAAVPPSPAAYHTPRCSRQQDCGISRQPGHSAVHSPNTYTLRHYRMITDDTRFSVCLVVCLFFPCPREPQKARASGFRCRNVTARFWSSSSTFIFFFFFFLLK